MDAETMSHESLSRISSTAQPNFCWQSLFLLLRIAERISQEQRAEIHKKKKKSVMQVISGKQ